MDRETRHELDRILDQYEVALREIRLADDDDQRLAEWKKVQTIGWELNALLPSHSPA